MKTWPVILFSLFLCSTAGAATLYVKVGGAGAGNCTTTTECTLTYAVNTKAAAGDTIILRDGNYTNTSLVSNCNAGVANNITIRAENERQAWLQNDGSAPVIEPINCSGWTIQGLHISQADNAVTGDCNGCSIALFVYASSNMTIRRNLVHSPNRYDNAGLIAIYPSGSSFDNVLEENEIYSYHRHGMGGGTRTIYRRNYCNAQMWSAMPPGVPNNDPSRGDSCIILYPASNSVLENNISENAFWGVEIEGEGAVSGNQILGHVSRNDYGAYRSQCRIVAADSTTVRNMVAVNSGGSSYSAISARGDKNGTFENITIYTTYGGINHSHDSGQGGGECEQPGYVASGNTYRNIIIQGASSYGRITEADTAGAFSDIYQFNSGGNTINGTWTQSNITATDPGLGSCRVFLPTGSAAQKAGIGATVLYAYENGVLQDGTGGTTKKELWNTSNKELNDTLRGAVIAGVNSVNGLSSFGSRFHPNCTSWPAGYGITGVASLTILSPTTGATYITASNSVTVSGTASCPATITSVAWSDNRGGSGTATGTGNWSAAISLTEYRVTDLTFTVNCQ